MKSKKFISLSLLCAFAIGGVVSSFSFKQTKTSTPVLADAPENYYASIDDSMTGNTLLSKLKSIINSSGVSVDYDWSRYEAADEDPNNSSNVILIYARNSVKKTEHVHGSIGWNREHTFPASKLSNPKAEKDNHIIFASDNKVNGARSNIKMGVVTGGSVVNDYNGKPTTCRKTSDLFDPHNVARGIVARTTMYAAAMYGYDPEDNFESIETMLRWHLEYQPDSNDMRRNDVVYSNQHNRNPFVDHPEYACRIWGNESATTKQICGEVVKGITISDESLSLEVNAEATISATSSDGSYITWENNNPDVISLSATTSSSDSPIIITALQEGNASITATAVIDDETYSATCEVTVNAKPVKELSSITLSGSYKTNFELGDTFTNEGLVVTANYTIGDSKILSNTEYTLTEPDMTSAGTKKVNISYTEDEITKTASYNIVVSDPVIHVTSISLDKETLELKLNEQVRLAATILPGNADNKEIVWSSSNESVATVSFLGLVSAKSVGEATITVTTVDGGLTATCKVKVVAPQPAGGGCGGSVEATSIILSTLSVLGIGLLLIKRKFSK